MSLKRFHFLKRIIEFDDKASREERWEIHNFACIRDIFETLNEKNASMRSPSPYLAIDEILYPHRISIGILQYNPRKPARYRLLYRSLCDAVVTYTYYTLPYVGKPSEINNEASKYYIAGTDEYTKYLVNGVIHYNSIKGSNISMDRYFTSVAIAHWALEKKTTIVGKMRLDRKCRPKKIKSLENREKGSVLRVFDSDEKIPLVLYSDKKKSDKRNFIVVSKSQSYKR